MKEILNVDEDMEQILRKMEEETGLLCVRERNENLGIPTRYAHTSYCYASLADTKAAVDLAREVVQELNREKIETF